MDYISRAKQFRTKKRLGQNFLVDEEIIDTIIHNAELSIDETVIEIGSGLGFVTEKLAKKCSKVIAIEIDDAAIQELQALPCENIEIIKQDILKTEFSKLVNSPVKIVANIPYYITSPILAHILGEIDTPYWENRELTTEIILMVQYEVAKRITANEKSPSKEYGLLSILVNHYCDTEFILKVPAKSFYPAPKVDSALVKLSLKKEPDVEIQNPALFKKITQAAFGTRRKTIKNALAKTGFNSDEILNALEKSGIDPQRRGETLSIKDFNNMTNFISDKDCFSK